MKLLQLGVVIALGLPLLAQADVEVFGKIRASVDYATNNDDGKGVGSCNYDATTNTNDSTVSCQKSKASLSSNASRIGFKGDEELGNGMTVLWQLDQEVTFDTGVFTSGMRQTFVGVSGGFGMVLAGKLDTPYKSTTGQYDIFSDTKADYNAIMGSANGRLMFDNRTGNTVAYVTPKVNGFTGKVAYVVANINSGDNLPISNYRNDQDAYSASANYAAGPLNVSAAYETLIRAGAARDNAVAWNVGGSYNIMDTATVALIYENVDLGGSNNDRNAIYGNVAYKMADTTLKLAVAQADKLGSGVSNGATQISVGAAQSLSKSTELYALYSQISNDNAGAYGFKYGPSNAVVGKDESVFSVGINHNFSSM